ncbi:DNA excision repair protein ERCC-5 [Prorops nasuta]|uniref:DNA excision repair protein ERCC-5 n=1 Tax=Prorops nasuta TaxID=863751 RepID=UPI0034CDB673
MGVHGLWRLIDCTGKPIPVESLEGKILAIDISIWIYQVLQGYQDRRGNSIPNAHLLGLFHRICKLLYYKIKPVFVFDGGVPLLKKNTIAARRKLKYIATSKAEKIKNNLINNLIKHVAVKSMLNKEDGDRESSTSNQNLNIPGKQLEDDIFRLPDLPSTSQMDNSSDVDEIDSDSSLNLSPRKQTKWMGNIHTVDVSSTEFKSLPADVRYDILTDLKETRKQNSWGRLHEIPQESNEFSGYQMKRLLKRRLVQESIELAEKEMGGKTLTLEELDQLLTEQGISTKCDDTAFRIASDNTTRLIYISDKNALPGCSKETTDEVKPVSDSDAKSEPVENISSTPPIMENMDEYEISDEWNSDIEYIEFDDPIPPIKQLKEENFLEESTAEPKINESLPLPKKYFGKQTKNPALIYMLEYSGLSQEQIMQLIENSRGNKNSGRQKRSDKRKLFQEKKQSIADKKIKQEKEADVTVTNNVVEGQELDLIQSNSESDDFVEIADASAKNPPTDKEINNEKSIGKKSEATINSSSSNSESDDFIEIQDVPIPVINSPLPVLKENNLLITINSDQKPEDDLFADIFENNEESLTKTETSQIDTSSEMLQVEKGSDNEKPLIISDNDETPISLDENLSNNVNVDTVKINESTEKLQVDEDKAEKKAEKRIEEITTVGTGSAEDRSDIVLEMVPTILSADKTDLETMKQHLETEQQIFTESIGKLERQATVITDQIRIEAQELLQLFGIPYVVAPMEAEAQCAYLEQINLTDGTITDDSDIWLFGGKCVYKNFFNNNKRVLQFLSGDIEHHFKLTRSQLIQLALLVGSDYTTGVPGVGPVTALEILAAFPSEESNLLRGLLNFTSWVNTGKLPGPGRTGLRNKLRNVKIEKGFPSQAVVQAYLFPTIDDSKDSFTWGKPNLVLLGDYTRQKFGWTRNKFDEIMNPVIKRMGETQSQKLLEHYFKIKVAPKSIEASLSKRVQKAVQKLHNDSNEELSDEIASTEKGGSNTKKKSFAGRKSKKNLNESVAQSALIDINEDNNIFDITIASQSKKPIEIIPQREKDKANALKKKLHAIEVFRKSKKGLSKAKKIKRSARRIKKEAELSESSSDSE